MTSGFLNSSGSDLDDLFDVGTGNQTFGLYDTSGVDLGQRYYNASEGTAGGSCGIYNTAGNDIGPLLCKKGTYIPYTSLNYVEHNDSYTGYIQTDVLCASDLVIQVQFYASGNIGGQIVGNSGEGEPNSFRLILTGGNWYLDFGSGSGYDRIYTSGYTYGTVYNIEFGNRYIKNLSTGSTLVSSTEVSSFTKTYYFGILHGIDGGVTARIYYTKIYKSGTLIRNIIPCRRKSDSMICMYDLVNKQFYTPLEGSLTGG